MPQYIHAYAPFLLPDYRGFMTYEDERAKQEEIERSKRDKRLQEESDLMEIVGSHAGMRFLYKLLFVDCKILSEEFCEPNLSYYKLGKRKIGLTVLNRLQKFDPNIMHKLEVINNE